MKIGIISEGHSDRAVISNILVGLTGLDYSDIKPLRPIFTKDETDKASKANETFSSWSVVKEECERRELIDGFLSIEGQDFIVIHLDSAECSNYGVQRTSDKLKLRELIIDQINAWLVDDLSKVILYAIAIEEIDAWILTIYEKTDSTTSATPKEKLNRILGKIGVNSSPNYDNFLMISEPLSKSKKVLKYKYLDYNHSLAAFYEEVKSKVLQQSLSRLE